MMDQADMADRGATPIERRFLEMIESLKRSDAIDFSGDRKGAISEVVEDSAAAFAVLEELYGVRLDPVLQDYHVRYLELGIHWYAADASVGAGGEFVLCELVDALMSGPPDDHSARDDEERELFRHLRVVDGQPDSGVIAFSAVRPTHGTIAPQMWVHRFPYGTFALDLDYRGYLEALLLTKGFHGWQFLYTDVQLADPRYAPLAHQIRSGLDFLTGTLPDPRYADLEARLVERLGQAALSPGIGSEPGIGQDLVHRGSRQHR